MKSKHKRNQHIREPWRKRKLATTQLGETPDTGLGDIGAAAITAGAAAATQGSIGKSTKKRNEHIREPWRNRKHTRRTIDDIGIDDAGSIGVVAGVRGLVGPTAVPSSSFNRLTQRGFLVHPHHSDDPLAGLTDAGAVAPGARKHIRPIVHDPAISEDNPDPKRPSLPASIKTLADFNRWAETGATAVDETGMPNPNPDDPTPHQWVNGVLPGKSKPTKHKRPTAATHTRYGLSQPVQPLPAATHVNERPDGGSPGFPNQWLRRHREKYDALATKVRLEQADRQRRAQLDDAEQKLTERLSNWERLDADTRSAITHLSRDAGIDSVLNNQPLLNAVNANDHAAMVRSLPSLSLAAPIMSSYSDGLTHLGRGRTPFVTGPGDSKGDSRPRSSTAPLGAYMVQPGDRIEVVAEAYGVSRQAIIDANDEIVGSDGTLYYDRVLTIPSPTKSPDLPGNLMREDLSFEGRVAETLIKHEEVRNTSYWDREEGDGKDAEVEDEDADKDKGRKTVGVGFNMDRDNAIEVWWKVLGEDETHFREVYDGTRELTDTQVQKLFEYDIKDHARRARIWFPDLDERSEVERIAIVNMVYQNVGHPGWPDTHEALKNRDYAGVAAGLEDSKTYREGSTRIRQMINIFKGLARQQEMERQPHDEQPTQTKPDGR